MVQERAPPADFKSSRVAEAPPDTYDPDQPRIGRRESEPHSAEVTYLHDVLATNFPGDRVCWDLHHYFDSHDPALNLKYDISYFRDLQILHTLSSYRATEYQDRVPTMAVNILSKSTWRADVGENVDYSLVLGVPLYVVFPPFHVATRVYKPPFLRAYRLDDAGEYHRMELRDVAVREDGSVDAAHLLDLGDVVPFRLGLKALDQKHEKGLPTYRMVLVDPEEDRVLPSKVEAAESRAEAAESRAEAAESRAKNLEEELSKYREKFGPV